MLEAYSDFTRFDGLTFTEDPYAFWHELQEECYSGYLVDDVFAGGTISTERSYLTGYEFQPSYTKNTKIPTFVISHPRAIALRAATPETTGSTTART